MSGLRKSNPYENLLAANPFGPATKAELDAFKEKREALNALGLEPGQAVDLQTKLKGVTGVANQMRFNFQTENEVYRKLDYSRVLEGLEAIDFGEIDANLKTDYLETKIRDIVVN